MNDPVARAALTKVMLNYSDYEKVVIENKTYIIEKNRKLSVCQNE